MNQNNVNYFLTHAPRGGPGVPGAINKLKVGGPFLHCKNMNTRKTKDKLEDIFFKSNVDPMIVLSFRYYLSDKS